MSILPDDMAPLETRFLLGASRERMGRSFAASLGSHVLGIALVALILGLAPERVYEVVEADRQNDSIVWLADESLGGGGGGGGKELLELNTAWRYAKSPEARAKVWQKMLEIHADQVLSIGTVNGVPQPVVVAGTLRNVPEKGIYNWDPGAYFGIYKPDTFWFTEPRRQADK